MSSGVYYIENLSNHHRYVGSSSNLQARFCKHLNNLNAGDHHCKYLQNAWNKYGENKFLFETILECPVDLLLYYEQQVLDQLQPEYNTYRIAGSPIGYKHTESAKQKVSLARKGKPLSEEHKRKLSLAKLGKSHPAYTMPTGWKKKLSDTFKRKGIKPPSRLGVRLSDEEKKKHSERLKQHYANKRKETQGGEI